MPASSVIGRRLGVYEVQALLGAGGMGEVYRARDTRLGRDVAIKILPRDFASDPGRLARFEREARILASLTHPHIGAIYGVEETVEGAESLRGLVLELVEGETLAERLVRGRLNPADAIAIARQIADALEAAHEQGIVHRDLKPANVKITPTGVVKVLDFGIAKTASGGEDETCVGTQEGTVIGTTAYMSPEQTRGQNVDKRTDIWALGCVLFEMLAGRTAFGRATTTDTLAAIVDRDPDWALLPAGTPDHVVRLLRRCLVKDSRERLRDIGDARIELADRRMDAPATPTANRRPMAAIVTGAVILVVAAVAGGYYLRLWAPSFAAPMLRFALNPPQGEEFRRHPSAVFFALSPDGSTLAFVTAAANNGVIWVQPVNDVRPQRVAGTEGAGAVFWSPDGDEIGFFAADQLKKVNIRTGIVASICAVPDTARQHGSWGSAGTIVFASSESGVISAVSETGGTPEVVVRADRAKGEMRVHWPQYLPDGRRFVYTIKKSDDSSQLAIAEKGGVPEQIGEASSNLGWVDPDYLMHVRDGVLLAQKFDLATGRPTGEPITVTEGVNYFRTTSRAQFTASRTGNFAFHSAEDLSRLTWFDRSGRIGATVSEAAGYQSARLSPDGGRLLFERRVPSLGTWDLWIADLARGVETRITSDPGVEVQPVWLKDGRSIVFSADRGGPPHLYRKDLASGTEEEVRPVGRQQQAWDVSPDGTTLLFLERSPLGNFDMFTLPLANPGEVKLAVPSSRFDIGGTRFSPDGNALAFVSDRSGRYQAYAVRLAEPSAIVIVSPQGGSLARWSRDGRELFYVGSDRKLMAVAMQTEPALRLGTPEPLFELPPGGWLDYEPSPDRRFLAIVPYLRGSAQPITMIANWKPQ